jgi:hypothetical protein
VVEATPGGPFWGAFSPTGPDAFPGTGKRWAVAWGSRLVAGVRSALLRFCSPERAAEGALAPRSHSMPRVRSKKPTMEKENGFGLVVHGISYEGLLLESGRERFAVSEALLPNAPVEVSLLPFWNRLTQRPFPPQVKYKPRLAGERVGKGCAVRDTFSAAAGVKQPECSSQGPRGSRQLRLFFWGRSHGPAAHFILEE